MNSSIEVSEKRYRFCGKERDEETGLYYFGARFYAAWLCRFISVDVMQFKYSELSPFAYCANNPIKYIDPDGKDWYEAKDGTKQYNPKVNENSKLNVGEKYLGVTCSEKGTEYRSDGSIMYTNEKDAYARMWDNSERNKTEEMGVITDNGVLVLPSYKNTENGVDLADYGYSTKNGNIVDARGYELNTIATVHTHPKGDGPSTYTVTGHGDLKFASLSTPYKPVYVIQMNDKKSISLIVASPNTTMKASGFNYREHTLPGVSTDNLKKGNFSLRDYTKQNNFRKLLGH